MRGHVKKGSVGAKETGEKGTKCKISLILLYSTHIFIEVKRRECRSCETFKTITETVKNHEKLGCKPMMK